MQYEVETELVLYVPVKIHVDALSKEEALELVQGAIPDNVHTAMRGKSLGWKALVSLTAPKSVRLKEVELKATIVVGASGKEKVRKVA